MCKEFALYSGLGTFELVLKEVNITLAREAIVYPVLLSHSRGHISNNQEYYHYIHQVPEVTVKKSQIRIILAKACPMM